MGGVHEADGHRLAGNLAGETGPATGTFEQLATFDAGLAAAMALQEQGLDAVFHHLDVTDEASTAALMDAAVERFERLDVVVANAGVVAEAGVAAIPNPLINITIQGRHDSFPKRRGLTRVKEMQAHGIIVGWGQDCVLDPWYSLGTADMLDVSPSRTPFT